MHEVRIDEVFWSHLYLYLHFWLLNFYSCSKTLRLTLSNRPVYLRTFSLFVTVFLEEILPRMVTLFFWESTTSWAYFEESGINSIFHWYAHWGKLVRLSFVLLLIKKCYCNEKKLSYLSPEDFQMLTCDHWSEFFLLILSFSWVIFEYNH